MKNFLMVSGAILASTLGFSQTDTANLDVVLADVQSIVVNPAQKDVTLTFANATDYVNGVSSSQTGHLSIVSTVDFDVTAYADTDLTDGTNTIPVSTISLTPAAGNNSPSGGTYPGGNLGIGSANAITIMSGIPADIDGQYNMDYKASGGTPYYNVPSGTYETIITYTLVPN